MIEYSIGELKYYYSKYGDADADYTKDDVELYALFAGVFGQFSGALFMHLKGEKAPPPGSTTVSSIEQVSSVPPEIKPVPAEGVPTNGIA